MQQDVLSVYEPPPPRFAHRPDAHERRSAFSIGGVCVHKPQSYLLSFVLAASVAFGGCSSTGGSASAPSAAATANVSGDYSGSIQDNQNGSGSATGTLAQHGNSVGGSITAVEGVQALNLQVSLTLNSPTSLTGSIVVDLPNNGPTCTFRTSATYQNNGSSAIISGSYSAVTNCSGDSGVYTLTQQCTDTVTARDRREPLSFPPAC